VGGIGEPAAAQAVARNVKFFDQPGGLVTSTTSPERSGIILTDGLLSNRLPWMDYAVTASRLMRIEFRITFLSTVAENFKREGTIREKYDVVTRSSEANVSAGYKANVVGFGWTNGVFLELMQQLPKETVERLAREQDAASAHQ